MKSLASLVLIFAVPALGQEPVAGDGPRGSSQVAAGETRYDVVGRVDIAQIPGVFVVASGLSGGYVELTSLATGRTIVAAVADGAVAPGMVAMLSADAAAALGDASGGVRVRRIVAMPQDIAQLRAGRPGESRPDAPPALLAALRRKLAPVRPEAESASAETREVAVRAPTAPRRPAPAAKSAPMPTAKPAPAVATKPATSMTAGYMVQVAAVSSADRARMLARSIGGTISAGPPVWRVRLGPYPDLASAERAKAEMARRGHPDATIIRFP